jgi:hypothetical protein
MGFLIEAIAEYGKNEFPTYCTHDFYYWSLENKLIKKLDHNCSAFVTIEKQFDEG